MASRTVDLGKVVGPAGPNEVSSSTDTALNGVLVGNGSKVGVKTLDTSSLTNDNNHVPTSGVVKSALDNVAENTADAYDNTAEYRIGDLCIYDGTLYKCNTRITSGGEDWNAAHWTPTTVDDVIKTVAIRPNLLDNWYFAGGGSQQGGGQFPINQRGQTSYSNSGYSIDRWKKQNNVGSISLSDDGVYIGGSTSFTIFSQVLNNFSAYFGKTVTLSIFDGSNLRQRTCTLPNSLPSAQTIIGSTSGSGLTNLQIYANADYIYSNIVAQSTTMKPIVAVKIELGDTQTLCRNEGTDENPVWVLNEIPDYTTELVKCMRYFRTFRTQSLRPTYGADFSPPMATASPTTGTITIGGTTYYTASSEP